MRQVLVTGASGFIGGFFASHLVDKGVRVRGTMFRNPPDSGNSAIEWQRTGDIGPETQWDEMLAGVDTVVHAAGQAHLHGKDRNANEALIYRVNTEGTLQLARRAAACGVKRFIYLSSIGVAGTATTERPITERTITRHHDPYAESKYLAECGLRDLCAGTGLEYVIVRPPLVYGPRAPGNFRRLVRLVSTGIPLPFGRIENRRSLISIENLVDVLYACMENPAAADEIFVVADRLDVSTPQLIRCIAEGLKRRANLVPVPLAFLKALGMLAGRLEEVEGICRSLQIDCRKVVDYLNWQPRVSPFDAIPRAAASYTAHP